MLLFMTFLCASAVFFFGSRLPSSDYGDLDGLRQWGGWSNVSNMFVFGGSYSNVGFDVHGEQPSLANPFGNPPQAGFNANGPQWVRKMTVKYNRTFVRTYDLATDRNAPYSTLDEQVKHLFLPNYSLKSKAATWRPRDTLFAIAFGVNDIHLTEMEKVDNMAFEVSAQQSYRRAIHSLYEHGARNFVFINTPPINRSPQVLALNPDKMLISDIAYRVLDTNQRIHSFAKDFADAYEDATVFHFDLNSLYQEVLDFPGAYFSTQNIKNTTDFCALYATGSHAFDAFIPECGIPVNEYFWLDDKLPTWPIHEAAAYQIVKLLESNNYIQW